MASHFDHLRKLALAALLVASACKRGPHECGSTKLANDDPQLWTVTFSDCGDKKKYGVTCTPDATLPVAGMLRCTCSLDGVAGKTYAHVGEMSSEPTMITAVVNAECGWTIE